METLKEQIEKHPLAKLLAPILLIDEDKVDWIKSQLKINETLVDISLVSILNESCPFRYTVCLSDGLYTITLELNGWLGDFEIKSTNVKHLEDDVENVITILSNPIECKNYLNSKGDIEKSIIKISEFFGNTHQTRKIRYGTFGIIFYLNKSKYKFEHYHYSPWILN